MGRTYAIILGNLAFAITIVRGLIHASSAQAIMEAAIGGLIAFAVVGWIVGELAAWIVEESIFSRMKTDSPGTTPTAVGS